MLVETIQNKGKTDLSYNMNVIRGYFVLKLHLYEKFVVFIAFCFFSNFLCAQAVWTKEDSVKLSEILNSETPISINSDLKKELEKSFIGELIRESCGYWNDFRLDTKTYDFDIPKYQPLNMVHFFNKPTSVRFFNLNNEYLKIKKFTIDSHIDVDNPLIDLQRNTNLTFPLDRKLHFHISGSYTLDNSHSSILPVNSTPYSIGAGLSFDIGKNVVICPQVNYQFDIIQKRWEWFWGINLKVLIK